MKVLVTGADGFVGSWLVPRLADAGHSVMAAVDPGSRLLETGESERRLERAAEIIELDVTAPSATSRVADLQVDAVVHLAAVSSGVDARRDAGHAWDVNAGGTARLAEGLARNVLSSNPLLLVISSGEVYGMLEDETPATEQTPPAPVSPYAASKLGAEIAATEVARRTGLRVVITRPFGHTGARQDGRFVIPSFARRIIDGKAMKAVAVPVGNLECIRDFLHVSDVVEAYRLILEYGKPGETYNIASGHGVSLREVFLMVADATGHPMIPEVDASLVRTADIPFLVGDAGKLRSEMGWAPAVSLESAVQEVVDACSH